MAELLDAVTSWRSLLLVLVVFGFAPGCCLRLIVLAYPRGDPRRAELIAELYVVPRIQRPLWVAEQLEVALFEGLAHRASAALHRLTGRRRAHTRSGHRSKSALRRALGVVGGLGVLDAVVVVVAVGAVGGMIGEWVGVGAEVGSEVVTMVMLVVMLVAVFGDMLGDMRDKARFRRGKPDRSGSQTGMPRSEADDPDGPGRGPDL